VAISLGVILFFVLCLVVLPAGAHAATGELPIPAEAGSVDSAIPSAIPSAGQILGSDTGNDQATAAQDPGGDQQASTNQGAASSATTTQQQPRNIVISVRIDSPGDDGAITQSNIAGAVAEGSNDSSTVQSGGAGGDAQPGGQQAATGQNAGSTATVTQDQAGNLVIAVRINSPGNNGPISQANTAVAISNAANTSATNQGAPLGSAAGAAENGAAGGAGDGNAGDPRTAIGPPAQQEQSGAPAPTAPSGAPSRLVTLPAPVAARTANSAGHPSRMLPAASTPALPAASAPAHRVARDSSAAGATTAGVAAGPAAPSRGESNPATATRPALRHAGSPAKSARRAAAALSGGVARTGRGIRQSAANLLGSLAPRRPLPAGGSSNDVTSAVLVTLIGLLGAALIYAGSTYLPLGSRLRRLRHWWRG